MVVPEGYIPGFVCSLETCSVELWGFIHYQPSMPGNAIFLTIMVLLWIAQLWLGIKHKSTWFCTAMLLGLASEALGYISRLLLHGNPFWRDYFLWYLICLTIGPVFIAAAIYFTLGGIVVICGEEASRIKPRTYTIFFVACDAISLVVQAVGGGIAASVPLTNQYMVNVGTNILVAGLSIQVASLFFFGLCSLDFLWRVYHRQDRTSTQHATFYNSRRFKNFLISLGIATITLFIRTVFRSVELSGGFQGHMANSEVQFMILDGTMVILASACLTLMHPGIGFGDKWKDAKFAWRDPKRRTPESAIENQTPDEASNGAEKS